MSISSESARGVLDAVARIDGERDHAEVRRRRLFGVEGRAYILLVRVIAGHGRRLEPAPLGLLLRGALGVRDEAQALVRDRRTAHHADPVDALLQPSLRPLDGGELLAQLLEAALIALALRRTARSPRRPGAGRSRRLAGRLAFLGGDRASSARSFAVTRLRSAARSRRASPAHPCRPPIPPYREPVIGSGSVQPLDRPSLRRGWPKTRSPDAFRCS